MTSNSNYYKCVSYKSGGVEALCSLGLASSFGIDLVGGGGRIFFGL